MEGGGGEEEEGGGDCSDPNVPPRWLQLPAGQGINPLHHFYTRPAQKAHTTEEEEKLSEESVLITK